MTNPIALDLLKLAEHYLSALHGSVARHDNIGLNLSCGGCALRDEIRDVLPKLAAAVSVPPPAPRADDQAAVLAEDLRYVLGYTGPRHAHEQPGVWDTSGKPCGHCARLAVAQANLNQLAEDLAAAIASCPGYEMNPNPCRCPCEGCKHHCGAHDPAAAVSGPCVAGEQQNETPEAPVCGRTKSVAGTEYPPCGREPGHEEAYCRSADGKQHFLAVGYEEPHP